MAITKPAGCALQLLGLGLVLAGCGVGVNAIAQASGASPGAAVFGVFLAAFGGWLFVLGRKPSVAPPAARDTRQKKNCGACAEEILADAKKCRYCGTAQP